MNIDSLDLNILKTLISNKKYALDFVNENDTALFSPESWNFANIIVTHLKTYKELPTLRIITEKLSKGNNDILINNIKETWKEVASLNYDDKEFKHDLEKIKKRFAEKQLINLKDNLSKLNPGLMDINKTVSEMQRTVQNIKSLEKIKSYDKFDIKDYLPSFVDKFNAKKNNPNIENGLKTNYSFFDFATNGIKSADFVIIAGESGFGKSLLLNNIAVQVWMQQNKINMADNFSTGKDIIYFSLEMPYEDCFNRLLSRLSGVPSRDIESAKLSKENFAKIKTSLDFIKNYPHKFVIVDITDACANDLEKILLDSDKNFDAVFIDYLGIMNTNEKSEEQDWLKQGIIAYETRAIARKHKLPIFSAVQLNRKSKTADSAENIGLSRLARSGTIATHATHVIQIENRINEEKYPDFLYHIIKNRKGPKGKGILYKNLSCASLVDKPMDVVENTTVFYDVEDISKEIEDLDL